MDNEKSEHFPHNLRIVRPVDYKSIYKIGKKVHTARFVMFSRENELGHPRLGITVSRKIGCAIKRNRVKRLFREIFRKSKDNIPQNLDFVINAKSGSVCAGFLELQEEFIEATKKISRKGNSK